MGRRKIEMKLVRDSSSRQVTFSKRRSGLFKKANELATLCGAEVAIVAFSPGGKPFSFGQPSVDVLADRFLSHGSSKRSQNGSHMSSSTKGSDAVNMTMEKLNQRLMNLMKESSVEKKKGKMLDKTLKKNKLITKGKLPMEGLDLAELQELKDSLQELHHDVMQHQKETEARSCLMLLAENAVKERENYDA